MHLCLDLTQLSLRHNDGGEKANIADCTVAYFIVLPERTDRSDEAYITPTDVNNSVLAETRRRCAEMTCFRIWRLTTGMIIACVDGGPSTGILIGRGHDTPAPIWRGRPPRLHATSAGNTSHALTHLSNVDGRRGTCQRIECSSGVSDENCRPVILPHCRGSDNITVIPN